MHDWFKAGFFGPDMLFKRVKDAEFEPLGQLVRRIGNSREPFLVPQKCMLYRLEQSNSGSNTQQPELPPLDMDDPLQIQL